MAQLRCSSYTPAALIFALFAVGCGVVPRDSAGTLDRIRGGELRVGVVHHPPWVRIEEDRISGIEPALIERWARQLDARITWFPGAEPDLVEALDRRELDVLAAGLAASSPYGSRVALTKPYLEVTNRYGSTEQRVLAVMPGESALLFSFDRFLAAQDRAALQREVERHERHEARQP